MRRVGGAAKANPNASYLFTAWGQFLTHDIIQTPDVGKGEVPCDCKANKRWVWTDNWWSSRLGVLVLAWPWDVLKVDSQPLTSGMISTFDSVVRILPSSKVKKINSLFHACSSSDHHQNLEKVSMAKLKGWGFEKDDQQIISKGTFQANSIRNLIKENNWINWHHWSMLQQFMVFQKNTRTCLLIAMECIWKWTTIVLAISCQQWMISGIPKLKRTSKPPMSSMIKATTKMLLVTLVF